MEKADYQDTIEKIYAERLTSFGEDHYSIPTVIFVGKVDLKMAPLPKIDLFIEENGSAKILKKADQVYSPLALSKHASILIKKSDFPKIKQYVESLIIGSSQGSNMPQQKRMESLRRSAILIVEDLFKDPTPEKIVKSQRIVGSFVYVLMREPEAYLLLSRLSSHDPYTLQHSVGASVNAIILGRKLGIDNEADLQELGLGGLLHDIGKTKISPEIINKKGPLDEDEWEIMRKHSFYGWEIIKDMPEIPERTKLAVLEHHEDKNGTGYPHHKPWKDVGLYSRIVAISDIFNALTTDRSYSNARPPFEAFEIMRDKLSNKIDDELFTALVRIYGGEISDLKPIEPQKAADG